MQIIYTYNVDCAIAANTIMLNNPPIRVSIVYMVIHMSILNNLIATREIKYLLYKCELHQHLDKWFERLYIVQIFFKKSHENSYH